MDTVMMDRLKGYAGFVCLCIFFTLGSPAVVAQTAPEGMHLLGMAKFSELRRSYYIAALYSDIPGNDPALVLGTQSRRRMEMRVEASRWSPRRFAQQWSQAMLINSAPDSLVRFNDELGKFTGLLEAQLERGDTLVVDAFSDGSSRVMVNGTVAFSVTKPGFLELLLNKWLGVRPPSREFKKAILGGVNNDLNASFLALAPTSSRVVQTRNWYR